MFRTGDSPKNGIRVRAALTTPFSRPPGHSLRPPFHNYSVPQGPTFAWNHKILANLHFRALKSGKSSVLSLKFDQLSVPRASNWTENQFFKTPNLAAVHSLSLCFQPFGPHCHTKIKVEYPPPGGGGSGNLFLAWKWWFSVQRNMSANWSWGYCNMLQCFVGRRKYLLWA